MQLDIFKCIAAYLLQNEAVSIQDLGSFYLKNQNIDFSKEDHIMHPPRKTIIFDHSDKEDAQFLSYIAQKLNISVDRAKNQLESFVIQLKQDLNGKGSLLFPGIGKFSENNGKVDFKAFSTNFHPDYLYLPSIPLRPVPVETPTETVGIAPIEKIGKVSAIHKEKAAVLEEEPVASTRKESIMEEKNYQSNPHYYEEDKGIFSAIGWPLFWIALLGILFFLFMKKGCSVLTDGTKAATEIVGDVTDTAGNVIDNATEVVTDKTDGDTYTGKYSDILTPEIIDQGCVIVVGSFKRSKNALRMREKIIAKGYQPYDEYHNGLNRVGLIFDCLDKDLIDFLQEIRRDIEPKAWYRIPGFNVAYEN